MVGKRPPRRSGLLTHALGRTDPLSTRYTGDGKHHESHANGCMDGRDGAAVFYRVESTCPIFESTLATVE